jgi:hypothetical protein
MSDKIVGEYYMPVYSLLKPGPNDQGYVEY